ncbi:MAG: adenylate/guanylate cyclase domain-containing protein [Myxococcaceae bacterium]|nr:adenylate/guanylate cyclase domain-containing protein [Myxococcaceae bacterium]
MAPPSVQSLFDWLVDGAPGAPTPMAVISRMGDELRATGVPIDRISAFVRTLHPAIVGRGFFWQPGEAVRVQENPWSGLETDEYKRSAAARVQTEGVEVRVRLGVDQTSYSGLDGLAKEGFTDYLIAPLTFMGGSTHSISFATKAAGGFTEEHLTALRAVVRPLCRVAETLALMRTAVNILNTYVGRDAGDRILKGKIQRGDTESIRCVIWFSDLRGFTSLSGERTPAEIISVLNQVFDCQVPHIERHGGEVLKFMGDGMLAIFPITEAVAAAAARAVEATREANASLDALNAGRAKVNEPALRFGIALHVGEVAYGNIGGASRLDFTAIGPSVNLASRIEGLTGKLEKRVLLSEALAKDCPAPTRAVGRFELKGVAGEQQVYELA